MILHVEIEQEVDGGQKRPTCREHRVEHEALAVGEVVRQPLGVGRGLQGLVIAHHSQKPDLGSGDEFDHALKHPEAGTKDGHHERSRLADNDARGVGDRGANGHSVDANSARRLVSEQCDELLSECSKHRG